MKRQEAFDRIRKNRDAARLVEMRRESERRRLEHEAVMERYAEQDRQFKAQMARHDEFSMIAGVLTQAACIPFMTPDYYQDIKGRMDRLANEHGVRSDKPRRELKVVGGKP